MNTGYTFIGVAALILLMSLLSIWADVSAIEVRGERWCLEHGYERLQGNFGSTTCIDPKTRQTFVPDTYNRR